MNNRMTSSLAALACLLTVWAHAESPADIALLVTLRERYPATHFDQVTASAISGLFEVKMGQNVAYVEPSGRYFLFGHLWDMWQSRDVTAEKSPAHSERPRTSANVDVASLPRGDSIVVQPGQPGARELIVFSDPNCGYCRALEARAASMPELKLRVFPVAFLDGSDDLAARVMCAKDRVAAWKAWMGKRDAPKGQACGADAVERNQVLAANLGVRATPTLISDDGRMIAGALQPQELKRWIAQRHEPSKTLTETSQ